MKSVQLVKAGYHEKVQPSMDELDYNSEGFDDGAGSEVAIGILAYCTILHCFALISIGVNQIRQFYLGVQCNHIVNIHQ